MNNSNIESVQQVELQILKEFMSVCSKLRIKYFAIGGTAIGAVRHNGFIPWDDDIDVAMLCEDYEKFILEAPRLLPEYLFLQTIESEPNYLNLTYAKIRDSRTTYIEESIAHADINHGIGIDIFPFYNLPQSRLGEVRLRFLQKVYTTRMASGFFLNFRKQLTLKMKIICSLLGFIYPNLKKVNDKYHAILRKTPYSDYVFHPFGTGGYSKMPRRWFEETVLIPFEDIKISLPKSYHEFLESKFGDYMKMPSVDQQKPKHNAAIIDTQEPYSNYLNFHR